MITLTLIIIGVTIFCYYSFKKEHGHTNFFNEAPELKAFIAIFGTIFIIIATVFICLKYLP